MKIKTITCHQVYNYGASLQAHALMYYLSNLGHDVEVIDYMPDYVRKHISILNVGEKWKRNILLRMAYYSYVVPKRLMQRTRKKKFDDFTCCHMNLTRRYNSLKELKKFVPSADVFFCGSDQIWNPTINNGLDPAFYVDFAPVTAIRASYAASFSVSTLRDSDKHFISEELSKLDFISVREKTGKSIIEDLGIKKDVTNVLDPVFLPTKEHWLSMIYTPDIKSYILVYDQENSKIIKSISKSLASKTGKKIIAFEDLYPKWYADKTIKTSGPIDFISLIANADYIITNSFHCVAFSLIFEKEFYVVPRSRQKVNSRMTDLLNILGIDKHVLANSKELGGSNNIDYTKVNTNLDSLRKQSYNYIDKVLAFAEKHLVSPQKSL